MKRYIVVLLLAVLLAGGMGVKAYAAENDSFTITAQVNSTLAIVCKKLDGVTAYGTWAVGAKALSTATSMTSAQGVMILNTSTVAINLAGTAGGSSSWNADTSAGVNKYLLKMTAPLLAAQEPTFGTAAAVVTGIALGSIDTPATNAYLYGEFTTPTASTSGQSQSMSVMITATIK